MYPQDEKIRRLMAAVVKARRFVMAGSMNSFHTHFDSMFELAVYLTATAEIRVKRLHSRELDEFGERILPGGDMYRAHRSFLEDAARYEQGAASCSSERHAAWLQALSCPILRLDGADDAQHNANRVVENYRKLQNHSG